MAALEVNHPTLLHLTVSGKHSEKPFNCKFATKPTRRQWHGYFVASTQPQDKSPSSSPPLCSPPACPQKISLHNKSKEITECSTLGRERSAPLGRGWSTAPHNGAPFFTDDQFSA